MALVSGSRVGAYEIVSSLGAGGMGEVYRARDTRLKREVALKVLPEAFGSDAERTGRFHREAEVLAGLNHPNIAAIYGFEANAIVMELVEGETLPGRLPIETALQYAKQIAEALEYAHERGVMHRDLKPANVKVTPEGFVKLLDFGLAKVIENPAAPADNPEVSPTLTLAATRAGVILGTAAYMSPEQAAGKIADRRADIWAFGAVLYEMLSGERAFAGESIAETLAGVLKIEPDWSALPASTPSQIRRLVQRCLTKDRKRRLQAIGEARIAIDDALAGTPTEETFSKHGNAGPRVLPWAAAGVLALAAGAGWWTAWRSGRPADNPLLHLSVDLGQEATAGNHVTAAISPDGTRLAFPVRGSEGKTQLATRLLDQRQNTLLAGTEGADDPFFSPDGQWIAFFAGGRLKKVSVRGSAVLVLCDAPDGRGGSWGEDDNIIATLSASSGIGLSRLPAAGGTPQPLTKPGERGDATDRWPQILPGGEAVLFMANKTISNYDGSTIDVLSLKTGQVKVVQRGGYFGRYLPGGFLVYIHQKTLFGVRFDVNRLQVSGTPTPLLDDVAADSNTAGGQFDFSRNGRFLYLSGKVATGNWSMAWQDSAGKMQPLIVAPGVYYEPRLSPDGKRLAFSSGTDIEVYDWEREARTRLTSVIDAVNNSPVWTRDGKHIVFMSEGNNKGSLQWIRSDGSGEPRMLLESKQKVVAYSFSPDGTRVAFSEENADSGTGLWTLPLDMSDPEHPVPGKPELFLQSRFAQASPSFSPDGRWMAYQSSESGRPEIFVRPFPAGRAADAGKWLISTGGGHFPAWSRDGKHLFYEGLDNRIMDVAYTGSERSFAPGKPRPWSDTQIFLDHDQHANFDAAPDGKRFAVAFRNESTAEAPQAVHITFLLNFFDEVSRRLSSGR